MARKRTGDSLELTKEEHVHAAKLAFAPADDPDRRSPLRKVSDIVWELNQVRGEKLPQVGPDTVNRAIRRAIESKWVVASPREVTSPDIERSPKLEKRLEEAFELDHALVVKRSDEGIQNRRDWEELQVQLGFALAQYFAKGGSREFRRSVVRNWGLGGGHAVRAFAKHMIDLKPSGGWPAQRVYSLAGSWSNRLVEVGGDPVLLDADSAATDFASCFGPGRELFRFTEPLIAIERRTSTERQGVAMMGSFGKAGSPSTAIVGVTFGMLQAGVMSDEKLLEQARTDARALLQEPGDVPAATFELSQFIPYPIELSEPAVGYIPWIRDEPNKVGSMLVGSGEAALEGADEICLLGGGPRTELVLYLLMKEKFSNVCQVATSSGTAEKLLAYEDQNDEA